MANFDILPSNDGKTSFAIWNWLKKVWKKINDFESRITTLESAGGGADPREALTQVQRRLYGGM